MDAKNAVAEIIKNVLEELRDEIKNNIQSAGLTASGRTAESMTIGAGEQDGMQFGVLYGREKFRTLETGRAGGAVPKNFTAIIRQWIIDKRIEVTPIPYAREGVGTLTPEERGLRAMAGAIAYKIKKEGTRRHRDGVPLNIFTWAIDDAQEKLKNQIPSIKDIIFDDINKQFYRMKNEQ